MRCFYCGEDRPAGSPEHVVPAALGGRLTTRKVCKRCNGRVGAEVDDPLSRYLMVGMPRALGDVRHVRKRRRTPEAITDGIAPDGERVSVRYSPDGREITGADGQTREDLDWVEIKYGIGSDLWVRFIAKVALGCASKLFDSDWTDTRLGQALRSVLWHGPIDNRIWPGGIRGLGAWPGELEPDHPVRIAIGDDRHLVGLTTADDVPGCAVAIAYLFGGQIRCELPLPDVVVPGSGRVWVIDHRPSSPPTHEDFDDAIERLLRERGWDDSRIDAARLTS